MNNINMSEILVETVNANKTLVPQLCDCSAQIAENANVFSPRMLYMTTVTFLVVVYMAVTFVKYREKFNEHVKWCIFILIITTVWLFESAVMGFL